MHINHLNSLRNDPFGIQVLLLLLFLLPVAVSARTAIPSVFIQNYPIDAYKASCQNWALAVSRQGVLYAANNSGLLTFDGNTWNTTLLPDGSGLSDLYLRQDTLFTAGETSCGYWTTDEDGTTLTYHPRPELAGEVRLNRPSIVPPFPLPVEVQEAIPTAFARMGEFCFTGTQRNGLYVTSPTGELLHHLHLNTGLQDNLVRALCVQQDLKIWVAFDNGLSQITLYPPLMLLGERSRTGKLLAAVLQGEELYVQTNTGYYRYTLGAGQRFISLPAADVLPYLCTVAVVEGSDAKETLTVASLFQQTEALGSFAQAEGICPAGNDLYWLSKGNEAALFHREAGAATLKCRILFDNYNMNLVTRGKRFIPLNDSLYLVSAMQGILLINTRKLMADNLSGGTVHLSAVSYTDANGTTRHLPSEVKEVVLPHHFRELTAYASTGLLTPNHQISYIIEGLSSDWSVWQKEGRISFLQLPAGSYTMRIRKYAVKGPFPETSLRLEVRPAWYNTLWAYLIYVLLIGGIVQTILRFRLRNQHRKEQIRLEAERQAEQQKMQQLRSEMLEAELQSKNNELTLQTSALVRKNQSMQALLEELERQKETLGDRYPAKLYNRMRTLMEETLNNQADWLVFESYFNEAHQDFMERLRQQYTDITTGDLRICCLLRMNLSTKEIASLLNVSVRAVELRRYRLRKRLSLEGDTNLADFLMSY